MGIVIITFIIIAATDVGLSFTMGQPCPGFYMDNPTDFFMRWALAHLHYTGRKWRLGMIRRHSQGKGELPSWLGPASESGRRCSSNDEAHDCHSGACC